MSRSSAVYVADSTVDVRMVEGLASRFDLTLLVPAALGPGVCTGALATDSVRTVVLPGGRLAFMARAAAWLVARRRRFDVIFVLDNLRAALAANIAARVARRPVVLQLGRPTEEYFRCRRLSGRVGGLRFWAGLAVVRVLVALNERLAAGIGAISFHVASRSRARSRRIRVIPWYGVEAGAFAPRPSPEEARRTLGLPENGPLALFRSRLAPEKDPITFLRALAILRAAGRPVTALYVGAEYRDFEAMASAMGVPAIGRDHVHPLAELPLFYRAASVTVQTSHAEGLGMSPLESLACEVPAVVSAVGGLVEVASGGATAVLLPPRDPEATAHAIAWTLDHPEEARRMAGRGREMVLARYTPEHAFDGWSDLAREVLRRPSRRTAEEVRAG